MLKKIIITILVCTNIFFLLSCNNAQDDTVELTYNDIDIFDKLPIIYDDDRPFSSTYSELGYFEKLDYVKNDFKSVLKKIDKINFKALEKKFANENMIISGIEIYIDGNNEIKKDIREYRKFDKYAIAVNRKMATTTIYGYDDSERIIYVPVVSFPCSVNYKRTRIGEYLTSNKYEWHLMYFDHFAQYCTRFDGNILFHSVLYTKPEKNTMLVDTYNGIMDKIESSGCVRLRSADSYYIYNDLPDDTVVVVYDGELDSPFGRPTFEKLEPIVTSTKSEILCCDPTDPFLGG